VNLESLFEGPLKFFKSKNGKPLNPEDKSVDRQAEYLKRADIVSRGYVDEPNYNDIKAAFSALAKHLSQYRDMRSQQSWNNVKRDLIVLAKYRVSNNDVLTVGGPGAVLDTYKTIVKSQGANTTADIEKQARSVRAGKAAELGAAQAELDALSNPNDINKVNVENPFIEDFNNLVEKIKEIQDRVKNPIPNWPPEKSRSYLEYLEIERYQIVRRKMIFWHNMSSNEKLAYERQRNQEISNPIKWAKQYLPSSRFEQIEKTTNHLLDQEMLERNGQVNESIDSHDKLVATVANYMYVKHPELFTQHGDGYVMSIIDSIVVKYDDADSPLQDIKSYALEIMDALGADRTNEARAQVKTDWRGHHLVNADGAVVQTYPKDADNLEVARERLYRDHRRLNTMTKKNEDLDAAFDAALNTLNESVNINTTTSSEGDDTVTVTATGEDAYELVNILKAAGIPHDKAQQYAPAPCDAAIAMPMEEEYANEPHNDCCNGDMDHMNTQSGGLNRRKMQQKYANPLGDNPLAESEDLLRGLWDLYKEAK
jgi:hypothetical protein